MIYGIIIGILLCVCGLLVYDKLKPKKSEQEKKTEEQIRKEEEEDEHYKKMWNYNPQQAYGGSKQ